MARLVLNLLPEETSGLVQLAQLELREPHEQIRFLLRQALQSRGLLPVPKRSNELPVPASWGDTENAATDTNRN